MVGSPALNLSCRLPELRQRALGAAEQLIEAGQRLSSLDTRLHRGAFFGQPGFLALLGRQCLDLRAGMLEPFAVALGGGRRSARLEQLCFDTRHIAPCKLNLCGIELAEGVEQRPMTLRVEQASI